MARCCAWAWACMPFPATHPCWPARSWPTISRYSIMVSSLGCLAACYVARQPDHAAAAMHASRLKRGVGPQAQMCGAWGTWADMRRAAVGCTASQCHSCTCSLSPRAPLCRQPPPPPQGLVGHGNMLPLAAAAQQAAQQAQQHGQARTKPPQPPRSRKADYVIVTAETPSSSRHPRCSAHSSSHGSRCWWSRRSWRL